MLIILTATPTIEEAAKLAEQLIDARLAACVQIVPPMTSVYFWEGSVQKESEHLLLIKTLPEKYDELEAFIRSNHSYDVPEIVAIRAENASAGYLKWMTDYLS